MAKMISVKEREATLLKYILIMIEDQLNDSDRIMKTLIHVKLNLSQFDREVLEDFRKKLHNEI